MPPPIKQVIESAYNDAAIQKAIRDLKEYRKVYRETFGGRGGGSGGFSGDGAAGKPPAMSVPRVSPKDTKAMKDFREITALARVEFDKLNLANRRGEISNEHFHKSVTELRTRVTRDLVAVRNQFEALPRSLEVQYGRSLVTLDHFATRSQEVLTGQTRLRTRITQGIQDSMVTRLPGGHLLAGAGLGGGALLGAGVGLAAAAGIAKATSEAIKYENALREVRKTTGMTREETERMGDDLLDLSVKLGMAETELAGIAATAGQLGVRGQEDILAFTETVAKLAAVSDLTAEEAADALGKIANAFEIPISESERLGSVINGLSNTTGASAADIVDALKRIGPAALNLGLTVDQVAGITATMIEMGIESRRAGTQVRNSLALIQNRARDVAKTMGITEAQFREMLRADPMGAIEQYLSALSRLEPQLRTLEINRVFGQENALGIQALVNATANLTDGVSALSANLGKSEQFWREQISLQEEFAIALDTTSGQWGRFKEHIGRSASEIGRPMNDTLREVLRGLNWLMDTSDRVTTWLNRKTDEFRMRQGQTPRNPDLFPGLYKGPSTEGFDRYRSRPPESEAASTLQERIAALEEEKKILTETGQATERLAEVNREIARLRKEMNDLDRFGLEEENHRLAASLQVLETIDRAAQLSRATTKEQADALQKIFELQDRINKLKEAGETLGMGRVQERIDAAEAELQIAQQQLRYQEEYAAMVDVLTENLNKIPAAGLQFFDPAKIDRVKGALEHYNLEVTRLRNQLAAGEITESEFFASLESISEGLLSKLRALYEVMKALGLMTPEMEAAFNRAFAEAASGAGEAKKGIEKAEESVLDLADTLRSMASSIRTVTRLADAFGKLSDNARMALDGIADVLDNAGQLATLADNAGGFKDLFSTTGGAIAGASSIAGIAAGIASIGVSIGSVVTEHSRKEDERLREQGRIFKQLQEDLQEVSRAFREATRALIQSETIGSGVTGEQAQRAAGILPWLEWISQQPLDRVTSIGAKGKLQELEDTGIDFGFDLTDLWSQISKGLGGDWQEALRIILFGDTSGRFGDILGEDFEGIASVIGRLNEDLGSFGDSVSGAIRLFDTLVDYLGTDVPDAFQQFAQFLLDNVADLSPEMRSLLERALNLDLSSPEGRAQLAEIGRLLAEGIVSGGPGFLGGLTPEDAERLRDFIFGLPGRMEGGGTEFTRSVQIARSITEFQASELVTIAEEQLHVLRGILGAITVPGVPSNVTAALSTIQRPQTISGMGGYSSSTIVGNKVVSFGDVNVATQLTDAEIDRIIVEFGRVLRARSTNRYR